MILIEIGAYFINPDHIAFIQLRAKSQGAQINMDNGVIIELDRRQYELFMARLRDEALA